MLKVGRVEKTEKDRVKDFKDKYKVNEVKPSKSSRMKKKEELMREVRDYIDR